MQVAYERILRLTYYVNELLATLKILFVKLFLATFAASLHAATSGKLASHSG